MDIKFNAIQSVSPVKKYQSAQRTAQTTAVVSQAADEVNVSANGKIFAAAMKEANATSEVREAKVAELREQIQSGTYAPSSRDIAAKMLGSLRLQS